MLIFVTVAVVQTSQFSCYYCNGDFCFSCSVSVVGMNEFNTTLNTIAFLRDDGVNPSDLSACLDQKYDIFMLLTTLKLKGALYVVTNVVPMLFKTVNLYYNYYLIFIM